jgi:hypothetical protein
MGLGCSSDAMTRKSEVYGLSLVVDYSALALRVRHAPAR